AGSSHSGVADGSGSESIHRSGRRLARAFLPWQRDWHAASCIPSPEMATILILVGTESGNAQMVADALKPVLESAGHAVDVTDKAATKADLEAHDVLLVVCATHGSG